MTTADLHTATGAYVLHALLPAERAEFERHLAACDSCTQEVRELAATAERLGLAVATAPPAHMREQVLRQIATVRQEPPQTSARGRAGRWTRALPRMALAACLAAAVAFGGVAVWQYQSAQDARDQARRTQQQAAELAAVLAAPDARTSTGKLTDEATGTVVVSRSMDRAALLTSKLPGLPDGKVYQLWFDDGGQMRSAGLLSTPDTSSATLLDGPVGNASGMGVTVEPAGGSDQPTTAPLGLMSFPA
ncbi:anti-sigma factor [Streptomyces sp. TRM66268-LWL]|uniref:Regulator of SigK n=1 Tax=Streptomyces polyasparticus TaxID=2767826 RepID=A0ABR7SUS9_9ACTN|nr:anti-sigma factor [Streptomyces polyasparticus]MBC9719257.1 anti-sigma factor [Streptomyces polyasparticus]